MRVSLEIQNLKCGGCENTIFKKLQAIDTINTISIDSEKATVSFDYATENDLKVVQKILFELGYPVIGDKNSIGRKAKSYLSCAIGRVKTN